MIGTRKGHRPCKDVKSAVRRPKGVGLMMAVAATMNMQSLRIAVTAGVGIAVIDMGARKLLHAQRSRFARMRDRPQPD